MNNDFKSILDEYSRGTDFKASIGTKGLFEQAKINERFFIGDQWYGARCGNDRPLVRHNVIKRIGNYKMSQILSSNPSVSFSAEGIPTTEKSYENILLNAPDDKEINFIMSAFESYYNTTAERVKLYELNERILKKAYISGTAVLYTYWDPSVKTGLFADENKTVEIKGDIACEVLDIEDIVFGDPYCENIEQQPFIILKSYKNTDEVLHEARLFGADLARLELIQKSAENGKVAVYSKLYKEYKSGHEYTIKCIKVCERAVVRESFDTELSRYPLALFTWERKNNLIYGESEVTYLIPNQIAINRMITANVWATMTNGMPIMLVNGDAVNGKISNEPGQIIKVYGSNEDVAGAIKYVTPATFSEDFDKTVNHLIENTLTQSGANEVALGDSRADNAAALSIMREAALVPLQIIRNRFFAFCEDTARIWADFWINYYGERSFKLKDKGSVKYIAFNGERYKSLVINVKIDIATDISYSEKEKTEMLLTLFDKGIINKEQLLSRLPSGIIPDIKSLLEEGEV